MKRAEKKRSGSRGVNSLAALGAAALASILAWAVWTLPPYPERMSNLVAENMHRSGVENPVTAVLLNFRGYDTLLEIGVLLLALVSVWSIGTSTARPAAEKPRPILMLLLRLLLPFMLLLSGYILWIGKYAPGGAFQAGAILAGGGILFISATDRPIPTGIEMWRSAAAIGLLVFILIALATAATLGEFLRYPAAIAGGLILLIEAAASISIGAILINLFVGAEPGQAHSGFSRDGQNRNIEKESSIE